MKLRPMCYGEFRWPHNPETIEVSLRRNVKELKLFQQHSVMQDCGEEKRVIQGEGCFYGPNCMDTFQELSVVLRRGGVELLSLPNTVPFPARFLSLDLIGNAEPELIRYRFVFWEDRQAQTITPSGSAGYVLVKQGDNFWVVAAEHSTTVEKLRELNPQIQWPNYLQQGEKVMLP